MCHEIIDHLIATLRYLSACTWLPNFLRERLGKTLLFPKYDGVKLHEVINEEMGQKLLSDALTNVIIPTFCWGIPSPHARTGGVLIVAQWRVSTLTQYLRGSAKPPTSTGESPYYLEIEKGLQHNSWRRTITSLKLNSQLSCCTCSCCNGSKAAAIAALHFLSCSLHFSPLSSLSQNHASFIGIQDISSTMAAHGLIHLSMVGATTIDKW